MKMFLMPQLLRDDVAPEQRRQLLMTIGASAKEKFDRGYPGIKKWFTDYDALYLLSMCIVYFVSSPEGVDTEAYGQMDFPHHFLEILQAFALMEDRAVTARPLLDEAIRLKEELREIGEAMKLQSFFYIREGMTDEEMERQRLIGTMRAQTTAIRNWAYHHQMFRMTSELMGKIQPEFENRFGLDPQKLVVMLVGLTETMQRKFDAHTEKVLKFYRKTDVARMVASYHEAFPDTVRMDEKQFEELFESAGREVSRLRTLLVCHSDLRLADIFTVTLEELVQLYKDPGCENQLASLLDSWSYSFGDLKERNAEYFVLDNPCLRRPFIKISDGSYFTGVFGVLPHIMLPLIESIVVGDASIKTKYERVRAKYLEDQTEALFRNSFPNAKISRGNKWTDPKSGTMYENDLAVILDTFMIIVECKSGSIDPPTKRGAPDSLKELVDKLIVEPAQQAGRFIDFLRTNKDQYTFRPENSPTDTFTNAGVRYYIPCGVTFENMGMIGTNIKLPIGAGFVKRDWKTLASSISLADLECVFELLPLESEKIHYLARRREFERHVEYHADEIDLLGFYLDNGFNIGQAEYDGKMALMMPLKSKELDPYFVGTAEGRNIQKPTLQMTEWWKSLLTYLAQKRPDRWLETSYVLLNTIKEDQEKCQKEFEKWKIK
jgi:hypothetical protein